MIQLRSKVGVNKRRKKLRVYLYIFLAIVLLGFCGLLFYTQSHRYDLESPVVVGASFVRDVEIHTIVTEHSSVKFVGIFSRNNKLFFPGDSIQTKLESIPAVVSAEVEVIGNTPYVRLIERVPTHLWCSDISDENSLCYFVDDSGVLFASAPDFTGGTYLKLYTIAVSIPPIGQVVVEKELLQRITSITDSVRTLGLRISKVEFNSETTTTLYDYSSLRILINPQVSSEALPARLEALKVIHDIGENPGSYEYVDARLENKIFLKEKQK